MRTLSDSIPLGELNTSMTINATAAWLRALHRRRRDAGTTLPARAAEGMTRNDILKECEQMVIGFQRGAWTTGTSTR